MTVPIYFVGPPGVGKTALAYSAGRGDAKSLSILGALPAEREVIYLPLSERDPMEIAGASYIKDGICKWADSESFVLAKDRPCLVILDELTAAHRVQRVAALRYADPSSGLHPQTIVVATGNPPEYAAGAGESLSAPEISRFRIVKHGPDAAIRWMCGQNGEVGKVGRFLRAQPRAALASPEVMSKCVDMQEPFATPRGWTRAAESGLAIDDWAGLIGNDGPVQYLRWTRDQDLPNPEDILSGASLDVPKRPDAALATATGIVEMLGQNCKDPERIHRAIAWIDAAAEFGHAGVISPEADRLALAYMHQCYVAAKNGLLRKYAKMQEAIIK